MTRRCAALPALLIAPPLAAQQLAPEVTARIDQVFAGMATPTTPGCALSVMRHGELVYLHGYGMANLEYDIPITPSSVFHVASISKQFTAFALSLLVADGKASWDDDIRTHVPEVPDFGEVITLRHLANHTSGIRDQWDLLALAGWRFEADVITEGDVLDIISRQTRLNFPVGQQHLYSNTGYTLLAVVVERLSGQSLGEFAQARIFGPLGMTHTHFHDDHNTVVRNRAYAYAPIEGGYRLSIPDFDVVGASSLHTTVEDMARWDRNFITAEVGGRAVVDGMLTRGVLGSGDTIAYALGLVHDRYRGLPTIGHGGADAGYRSAFTRFPEQDVSLAVLCNFPASNPGALVNQVADVVLEDAFPAQVAAAPASENPAPPAVPISDGDLDRLAGFYAREGADMPARIMKRDGTLFLQNQRLVHLGGWNFRPEGAPVTVQFATTPEGGIIADASDGVRYVRQEGVAVGGIDPTEYVGRYWSDDLGTEYQVREEEGKLVVWTRKNGSRTMTPFFRDGFAAGVWMTFHRDLAGRVDGFTLSTGRAWKVGFRRVGG